jgi:hypothetical protein
MELKLTDNKEYFELKREESSIGSGGVVFVWTFHLISFIMLIQKQKTIII